MKNIINETILIKTRKSKPGHVDLTGMDLLFGTIRATSALLLRESVDIGRLIDSLQSVVDAFPEASGRLGWIDDRLVIVMANQGVVVEVAESEKVSPEFGPDIFPMDTDELIADYPRTGDIDISSEPLLAFRVTRFKDGIVAVGMNYCHALADGTGIVAILHAWSKSYSGEELVLPSVERQFLRQIIQVQKSPSEKSGFLTKPFPPQIFGRQPLIGELFSISLTKDEHEKIQEFSELNVSDRVSFSDCMHAMVFKAFCDSSSYPKERLVSVSLPYDVRRAKGSPLPADYFGNATILRALRLSLRDINNLSVLGVARLFSDLGKPDIESMLQDIGYCQSQYDSGSYTEFGMFSEFLTPNIAEGIYINNALGLCKQRLSFGDQMLWSGAGITARRPFGVCLAVLVASLTGGISIRLSLGKEQVEKFKQSWRSCVDNLLAEAI